MSEPTPDDPPVLAAPADGTPPIIATVPALARAIDELAHARGPLGVDTERAQSYRYSAKAYLLQLRRAGAGTSLIDPVAFEQGGATADLSSQAAALQDAEWIIHAASQDLPCLAEIGFLPRRLFDTELAGRLLGLPRVALGTMIETAFGVRLLKEHSAADWSRRPIPDEWLDYAALDVELLAELRDWLAERLVDAGKLDWAMQEFDHLARTAGQTPVPRADPWRRTNGIHHVRSQRGMAVVREVWLARDKIARESDRAPGRILADRSICELAALADESRSAPRRRLLGRADLRQIEGFRRRHSARYENTWLQALQRAQELSRPDLPPRTLPVDGPPPVRSWESRAPEAYARWSRLRAASLKIAAENTVPVENLIAPDLVRRVAWEPPDAKPLADRLAELGARPWQIGLLGGDFEAAVAG